MHETAFPGSKLNMQMSEKLPTVAEGRRGSLDLLLPDQRLVDGDPVHYASTFTQQLARSEPVVSMMPTTPCTASIASPIRGQALPRPGWSGSTGEGGPEATS